MTVRPGAGLERRSGARPLALVLMSIVLAGLVLFHQSAAARAASGDIVLGTTVALQASGLLDVLVPMFEQSTGRHLTVIAVSTGQALALGTRGEVEILLVNSPEE